MMLKGNSLEQSRLSRIYQACEQRVVSYQMIRVLDPSAWATTATTNLISLVLVIVTGVYVILTWRIANANKGMLDNIREQYRDSLRPIVFPSIQVREQIVLVLVFANTGRSPAYRVRASIDTDFFQFANPQRNIRNFNIFNQEIPVLAPGTELPIDLAQGFNLDTERDGQNLTPTTFNVTVSYASRDQEFEETAPIDLKAFFQTHHSKTAAEWLGRIEQHLSKIAQKIT